MTERAACSSASHPATAARMQARPQGPVAHMRTSP